MPSRPMTPVDHPATSKFNSRFAQGWIRMACSSGHPRLGNGRVPSTSRMHESGLRASEAGSSCTDGHTQSWRRQMESRKRKAPARRAALSPQHEAALRNIALRARSQTDGIRVREIAADASAPAGATVLFTGVDSATAQEAAAVLANEVGREIYRVDLKEVTSKYIGETEKN